MIEDLNQDILEHEGGTIKSTPRGYCAGQIGPWSACLEDAITFPVRYPGQRPGG